MPKRFSCAWRHLPIPATWQMPARRLRAARCWRDYHSPARCSAISCPVDFSPPYPAAAATGTRLFASSGVVAGCPAPALAKLRREVYRPIEDPPGCRRHTGYRVSPRLDTASQSSNFNAATIVFSFPCSPPSPNRSAFLPAATISRFRTAARYCSLQTTIFCLIASRCAGMSIMSRT